MGGGGGDGKWERGLFCILSFSQFLQPVGLYNEYDMNSECEDSTAFEVKWRTVSLERCALDRIRLLIRCTREGKIVFLYNMRSPPQNVFGQEKTLLFQCEWKEYLQTQRQTSWPFCLYLHFSNCCEIFQS